ncbi:uncharacterized protein [Watersipora subatra]|uniref:uncharacterized protein n=1 Tax=Watersipora subatra TaxID=2589382 RepID=UPI00355B470F
MLREIKNFSQQPDHGSVVALVIMSHGDMNGNISGNADGTHCSVQEVVDALCQPELKSSSKLVFLTFCRGFIGSRGTRCNRTNKGWETTTLKPLAMLPEFNPITRGVFEEHLKKVRAEHPFPSVDVPVNCYFCYSTLPDSWSIRYNQTTNATNLMWQCLEELLSNLYTRETNIQVTSTTTASVLNAKRMNARRNILEENELSSGQSSAVQTQPITTVELTSLLIDLSGVVRERSEFTQYLNFCYALDKDSEPVALQVLPADLQT